MVRTKKRVPAVISKILKAIEDKPPVEAASLLQAAADDEDSVENQVLLLQARIKLLQDTQKPKRTRRKRKPKPAPVVEEVIEIEPEPEEEKTGTVTAVDLDNLGALFGAVERSAEAAEAAPPPAPPKKQNGTGSVDFGELNALMSDDAPTPDTQDAVSQQKEIDPDESDDTAPSASKSGAFEMPDLSALNDLGDTGEDPSDDDLSALMSAMSGQTAEPEPQDEDTSADASDDDLSALMGAMQGIDEATPEVTQADPDQSETSDSAAPSTPASGSVELPDLSALNDLDDSAEDPSDDDLSALMSAMSGQTAEPEPQDEDTSADASDDDLSALMGAMQGIDEATPEVTQADPDQSETSDSAAPSTPASGSAELPDLSALNDLDDTGEDPSDDDLSALMSTMSGQTAEPEPQDEDTSADASDDDLSALMGATQGVDDAPAYHTVLEAETAVADSDNPTEENTPDNMADLIETGSDQQKIEAETTIDAGAVLSEATDGVIEEENPDHANPQDETLENPTETFETPSTPITGFESEAVVADAEPALDPASEVEASSDPAGQTKTLSHRAAPETEAPADQIASIDDLDAQSGQHDTDDDGSDDLAALLSSFSDQGNSPLSVGETPEVETSPSKDHVAEQTDDQTLSQAEQSTDVVGPEEDHDPASAQPSETANGGNLESLSDMFSQMDPSTGDSAEDSAEFVTGSDEKQDADDDGLGGLIALHDALPDQKALEETSDFTKPEDIPSSVESATDQNETKIGTDEVTENDQPIEEFGNEVAASPDPAQSALDAPDVPSIDPEETSETVAEEPDYSEFEALMAGQPQETEMPLAASGHETDHVAEPISPPATDDGPKVVVDADSLPVQTAEAAPEMIPEQTAQPAHASTTDAAPDYSEFEALMAATAVDDVSGAESMAETYLPEPGIQDSDDAEVVTDPPQPPAEEPPLTPSSEPEMSPEIVAEPVSAPVPPPTTEPAGTRSERKKKATLDDLYQFFPK